MPRPRNLTPSYLRHSKTGRGRLVWTDRSGVRHERLLPGPYGSRESLAAKAQMELDLSATATGSLDAPEGLTLAELLAAYLDFATGHYRAPDGTPTSELSEVKIVIKALRELYAGKPVVEFGPLCVKAAVKRWVSQDHTRSECNRRLGVIKRIFRWAVSEQLAPVAVQQAIATVAGLQKGRTTARELPPVLPVADLVVDATLPHVNRHVRGMIELQRLTGMRPGEACMIRRCDIDMTGDVWFYRPPHHKGSWRGKSRSIAIGPKAQAILKGFFTTNLEDYLFSPRRAVEEVRDERSRERKTPRYPSHMRRNASQRKRKPKRSPQDRYSRGSYGVAIDRGAIEPSRRPATWHSGPGKRSRRGPAG